MKTEAERTLKVDASETTSKHILIVFGIDWMIISSFGSQVIYFNINNMKGMSEDMSSTRHIPENRVTINCKISCKHLVKDVRNLTYYIWKQAITSKLINYKRRSC